jgi:hypothetical protein
MSEAIPMVESSHPPVCPHCEKPVEQFEFRAAKASTEGLRRLVAGDYWVTVVTCVHCHKVLGVCR